MCGLDRPLRNDGEDCIVKFVGRRLVSPISDRRIEIVHTTTVTNPPFVGPDEIEHIRFRRNPCAKCLNEDVTIVRNPVPWSAYSSECSAMIALVVPARG